MESIRCLCCFLFILNHGIWAQETTDNASTTTSAPGGILPWYIWFAMALAFSIAVIVIGLSCICIVYSCQRYRKQKRRAKQSTIRLQTIHEEVYGEVDDWELPRKQIKLVKQLGIGEYGPIYDAEVKLNTNIMSRALVKVFQQGTSQDLVRYREDIDELMTFNHPNIGKLLGMVSLSPYYIVLELTVNGDLKSFLLATSAGSSEQSRDNGRTRLSGVEITTAQRVAMATDAASGLAYLEGLQYAHRDLAARNCMVTQHLGVKIADYKVSRYLFRSEYAVQADGSLMPLRWMAPESILQNEFKVHSSVWSFGVLLWEVMSQGDFPYSHLSNMDVITATCYDEQRLPRPQDCPQQVYSLMERCWTVDPQQRPLPSVIHRTLESSILTNRYKHSENAGDTQLFY